MNPITEEGLDEAYYSGAARACRPACGDPGVRGAAVLRARHESLMKAYIAPVVFERVLKHCEAMAAKAKADARVARVRAARVEIEAAKDTHDSPREGPSRPMQFEPVPVPTLLR